MVPRIAIDIDINSRFSDALLVVMGAEEELISIP